MENISANNSGMSKAVKSEILAENDLLVTDLENEYEETAYICVIIEGKAQALPLSDDRQKVIIDGAEFEYKTVNTESDLYIKLSDGRTFPQVNDLYD